MPLAHSSRIGVSQSAVPSRSAADPLFSGIRACRLYERHYRANLGPASTRDFGIVIVQSKDDDASLTVRQRVPASYLYTSPTLRLAFNVLRRN
jgi:hypothetical protein